MTTPQIRNICDEEVFRQEGRKEGILGVFACPIPLMSSWNWVVKTLRAFTTTTSNYSPPPYPFDVNLCRLRKISQTVCLRNFFEGSEKFLKRLSRKKLTFPSHTDLKDLFEIFLRAQKNFSSSIRKTSY